MLRAWRGIEHHLQQENEKIFATKEKTEWNRGAIVGQEVQTPEGNWDATLSCAIPALRPSL